MYSTVLLISGAAAASLVLGACSQAPASSPGAALPPTPVAEVLVRSVEVSSTHTARVEAAQRVELRPRVSGVIEAVLFQEGDLVSVGQTLFRIDPRPFDAALQRAAAELAHAEARLVLARAEAARADRLGEQQAISVEERERRRAAALEAQARADAARAALSTARLDREFADVKAPIPGRAGRALVTRGNFVAAGMQQSALTTIVSAQPLHVYLDVSDGPLAAEVAAARQQGQARLKAWRARVLAPGGSRVLAEGPIDFADNEIMAGTGTLRLRARVPATDAGLMPGMFARVQLVTGERREAVLIDDKAVGADQGQRYVLVAKPDNVLEYRPVKLGPLADGLRVVQSGLAAGDAIVVSGLTRVRPGTRIDPQRVAMGAQPAEPARADNRRAGKSPNPS